MNMIGDRGATHLANVLKTNETIVTLGMRSNRLGSAGVAHIAEMYAVNPRLGDARRPKEIEMYAVNPRLGDARRPKEIERRSGLGARRDSKRRHMMVLHGAVDGEFLLLTD